MFTEVMTDVADLRFEEAMSKKRKLINIGFHRDLIITLVAKEKNEQYKTLRLCQQKTKDRSLVGHKQMNMVSLIERVTISCWPIMNICGEKIPVCPLGRTG